MVLHVTDFASGADGAPWCPLVSVVPHYADRKVVRSGSEFFVSLGTDNTKLFS
ncbi:hypothetical protein Hanom_Chr16g01482131 [Helianthus anomalus]